MCENKLRNESVFANSGIKKKQKNVQHQNSLRPRADLQGFPSQAADFLISVRKPQSIFQPLSPVAR